jgi:dTDP-4-amino-4,6-dideoxygalactose transaminase
LNKEEEKEVIDTLRSGWLTTGPKTKKFEREFAKYTKSKYAIGVNSCTAALHLALLVSGVKDGDEVITTPLTFAATVNVILHQRAIPVFVDVEFDTLNINADAIESKVTENTKAIIPVHFAGHPCEMDKILKIAKKYNLKVIEDAAHCVEGEYKGKKVGSISNFTCFSFYATKNITTGEGGMLTTNNREMAEKVKMLSLHGISKNAWNRYGQKGYQHWDILYPGYKYNMSDIQASIGLCQLKKIKKFLKLREEYVRIYDKAFKNVPEIIRLKKKPYIKHAHHLYVILVKSEQLDKNRDEIINLIQKENIGIGIHFRAVHLHPFYQKKFGFRKGMFPIAEYASRRVISLPLYPKLTENDIKRVIKVVKKIIKLSRKRSIF